MGKRYIDKAFRNRLAPRPGSLRLYNAIFLSPFNTFKDHKQRFLGGRGEDLGVTLFNPFHLFFGGAFYIFYDTYTGIWMGGWALNQASKKRAWRIPPFEKKCAATARMRRLRPPSPFSASRLTRRWTRIGGVCSLLCCGAGNRRG